MNDGERQGLGPHHCLMGTRLLAGELRAEGTAVGLPWWSLQQAGAGDAERDAPGHPFVGSGAGKKQQMAFPLKQSPLQGPGWVESSSVRLLR